MKIINFFILGLAYEEAVQAFNKKIINLRLNRNFLFIVNSINAEFVDI